MQAETGSSSRSSRPTPARRGLPDASFDLVLSEYGASIWVDPYRWIPEAARLLRPGGRLVFLRNSTLVVLCYPDDERPASDRLQRPQFADAPVRVADGAASSSTSPTASGSTCCARNGFEVERLLELHAPESDATHAYYAYVTAEWARQWPAEEIWVARKR